ncbi:hypothetical protein TcasGA2_TC032446 [Tribolium castaneum]|uniref:Uncharacterized protein n=1 Tax=Tribolium castaneum TaxID=7070 RepID=A0A139WLP7_TRICA|nr:hypothetical protein TcasGA2_TC032446 [Tribolium castaneum]
MDHFHYTQHNSKFRHNPVKNTVTSKFRHNAAKNTVTHTDLIY